MTEEIFEKYLYYPDRIPEDMPPPPWTPAGAREVRISTADGVLLHGLWWDEPEGAPAVLFLHGNAQEVYSWSLVREDLEPMGTRMLLVDYRGYGKSGSSPTEAGLYEDGRAALAWLAEQGVTRARTILFGKSLGGAVACEIARGAAPGGLVLESSFTSLASVARNLFPFLGTYEPAAGVYESIAKMREISCPVLVIHGEDDMLIPVSEGVALYEAAREPKELLLVRGAGHNDVSLVAGSAYGRRLADWMGNIELEREA